ncbi:MAG: glycine cleavage system protein T [Dehalococcoidia bacterium]|nr:glycine cleavage system protein T [Dehalococcoidia bacterium]
MDLKTVLHQVHTDSGARMVPFGGWDMPVQYGGIISEVAAVRKQAGLFDVSHMGRLYIEGKSATNLLDLVLTSPASTLSIGKARYCMICDESAGIIDDTIFYRLAENRYLLIPNAGNREHVINWLQSWIDKDFAGGCFIDDQTLKSSLIAIQGPNSSAILDQICTVENGTTPSSIKGFSWADCILLNHKVMLGRTGYTGEDGFEIVVDSDHAVDVWHSLTNAGATPCGLGARDVLRLEAALPLHGHEISINKTPIEAGLSRFVRKSGTFVGSEVIYDQLDKGTEMRLVGLKVSGRSAPRAEYPILRQGEQIGYITSGSYSPTLDTSIAMGYVLDQYALISEGLKIDIRGKLIEAELVQLPFYSRPRRP